MNNNFFVKIYKKKSQRYMKKHSIKGFNGIKKLLNLNQHIILGTFLA